jgi:hypothetical protein
MPALCTEVYGFSVRRGEVGGGERMSECKHVGSLFIASETSTGDVVYRKRASVCPRCGMFTVWINGVRMTFHLVSDGQVAAAGRYAAMLEASDA